MCSVNQQMHCEERNSKNKRLSFVDKETRKTRLPSVEAELELEMVQ